MALARTCPADGVSISGIYHASLYAQMCQCHVLQSPSLQSLHHSCQSMYIPASSQLVRLAVPTQLQPLNTPSLTYLDLILHHITQNFRTARREFKLHPVDAYYRVLSTVQFLHKLNEGSSQDLARRNEISGNIQDILGSEKVGPLCRELYCVKFHKDNTL